VKTRSLQVDNLTLTACNIWCA